MAAGNVAIVKLSSIGDVVHALPVAVALKRAQPGTRITWIAEAREATLLAGHAALDEIIVADTRGWRRSTNRIRAMREALVLARGLRERGFDVALDLQGLLKSGMLTALTRARRRIGLAPAFRRERASVVFTNERVTPPSAARHVVEHYLALLGPLGVTDRTVEFRLPVDAAADARVDAFLAGAGIKAGDRLVVINPGAGRADKRWPVESFCAFTRGLAGDTGARVVVLWGPGEDGDARAIADATPGGVAAPPTTLRDLAALARRARLFVAGDTGPLHVAAAVGTPCLALFGPTSAVRNGPYGAGHQVLVAADGRLASIVPADALAAAARVLDDAA